MTDEVIARLLRIQSGSPTFRVFVCGNGGSGKSTIARAMGSAFAAPVVEIDSLRWVQQWTLCPVDEVLRQLEETIAPPRWVVEDGSIRWVDFLASRADAVVWLDPPRRGCMVRVVARSLQRWAGLSRSDLRGREPLRLSVRHWQWCWRYPTERAPVYRAIAQREPNKVLRLTRWRDIRLLARVRATDNCGDALEPER
jgi:adenylate kinase family enzyme